MPELLPFRAVRPAWDKAGLVTSLSFESYGREVMLTELRHNPYSFLHIINAGYDSGTRLTPLRRFKRVAEKYRSFLSSGVLVRDQRPCFYMYELLTADSRFLGLFGATSTADYRDGRIRKHEETIARREALFADYLEVVQFNAEPVLLMYPDEPAIKSRLEGEADKEPLYCFETGEGNQHRFWAIDGAETIYWLKAAFAKMDAFYIADGHHRSASSNLLAQRAASASRADSAPQPYNYFMSCLLPESEIRITSFTRLIKDLNGYGVPHFLEKLASGFHIAKLGGNPPDCIEKNQFLMYLDNSFYFISPKQQSGNAVNTLPQPDAYILYSKLLKPILSIEDLRNDKRIRYGYGKDKVLLMKRKIDRGDYAVGFDMKPVTAAELKAIADAGLVMPPKSTYIEPKMRSGLAIYEL